MEKYNYLESVTEDVKEYINNEITLSDYENREELEEYLNDILWADDSVTGNASGSYTFSSWKAEGYLCHNMNLLAEACNEFGNEVNTKLLENPEACDVTIRCYLLNQAISDVLDELWEDSEED